MQENILAGSKAVIITDLFGRTNIKEYAQLQKPTPIGIWAAYYINDVNRQYRESLTEKPDYKNLEGLLDYTDAIQGRMDQTVEEYRDYIIQHGYIATMIRF